MFILKYRGKAVESLTTAGNYIFYFQKTDTVAWDVVLAAICGFRASDRVSIPLLGPCHQKQGQHERA